MLKEPKLWMRQLHFTLTVKELPSGDGLLETRSVTDGLRQKLDALQDGSEVDEYSDVQNIAVWVSQTIRSCSMLIHCVS